MKPLLSIGIIFKNEIHCIERCLKSFMPLKEGLPCEIVMADTGSTDGSRSVAEKYADTVIDFPWINDFAAARNAVLEHCQGEWMLTVDCDEWVEDVSEFIRFFSSSQIKNLNYMMITARNYTDLNEMGKFRDMVSPRLFKQRNGKVRYVGKIHENLQYLNGSLYTDSRPALVVPLMIYHDGYAIQKGEEWDNRRKRNMILLEEHLKENPDDIRCLIQCVQSALNIEQRVEFAERLVEATWHCSPQQEIFRANAYSEAVMTAYAAHNTNLLMKWATEAKERFPDSYYVRIDVYGAVIINAYEEEDWDTVLEYATPWRQAIEYYDQNEGWHTKELSIGALAYNDDVMRFQNNFVIMYAACQKEDWAFAQKIMDELSERPSTLTFLIKSCYIALGYVIQLKISDFLAFQWNRLLQDDKIEAQRAETLRSEMLVCFSKSIAGTSEFHQAALRAIADMGTCDPARCARALQSRDPRIIEAELNRIENWNHTLDIVVAHAVALYVPLPDKFFKQRSNDFADLAQLTASINQNHMVTAVLRYAKAEPLEDSILRILWLDNLSATALFTADWANEEEGLALCKLFAQFEGDILTNLYRYEAIEEEDLLALPAVHRFGWRLCKGIEALENGNTREYVQQLKASVKDVPEMKKTLALLSDHIDEMRPVVVTPEIQALAEQIRSILAQYAPDDPAVIALKQSSAYQQVAYLLEREQSVKNDPALIQDKKISENRTYSPISTPDIRSVTALDHGFSILLEECSSLSIEKLIYRMRRWLGKLPAESQKVLANNLNHYPFFDDFRPDMGDCRFLWKKAELLNTHANEYLWLYHRLEDSRSKKLLYAILRVWYMFDFAALDACIEHCFDDYFDPDILPCVKGEVVVDLGAYTGDTALSFINTYGKDVYRHYYCYDASAAAIEQCKKNTGSLPNMIYCQKGVGEKSGEMYLNVNGDPALNSLSATGDKKVNVVSLDEDITEPITLLKMDIEGMELDAIRGAAGHIKNDRPKMAIAVYHNNEDLWQIPRMIDELCPDCRFYLRYHGGNVWPTEITFFAIPNKS